MHDEGAAGAVASAALSSKLPTLRSRWHRVCDVGWGEAIDGAAVFVDRERCTCYVHGGRVLKQGNKVSSALYVIGLGSTTAASSTAAAATSTNATLAEDDDDSEAHDEVHAEASSPRQHGETPSLAAALRQLRQSVWLVEHNTPHVPPRAAASTSVSCTACADKDAGSGVSSPPSLVAPALYDHVLFRHGSYLVLHGGRDAYGVVHNRLLTYHLSARTWEDLYGLLGGCVAPRLYGHAVAPLDESNGTYLLLGVESDPRGVAHDPASRKRCRAEGSRASDTVAASTEAARVGLSAFVLHMNAFQKGWTRLTLQSGGPAARRYFALDTHARVAPRETGVAAEVAYVIGGKMGSKEYLDAWQLTLATGMWRAVHFDLHPDVDLLPVPLFTSAQERRNKDSRNGDDKLHGGASSIYDSNCISCVAYSVQPYVVYVVPSWQLQGGTVSTLADQTPAALSLLSISRTRAAAHRARRDGSCYLHTFALAADGATQARRAASALHCRALSTVQLSGLCTTNNLCFVTLVAAQSWLCRVGRTGIVEVALLP